MSQILIVASILVAACFGALVALRVFGLIRPFGIPTAAMAPAITPGDHVIMEAVTYLRRKPQRGDIVAFRTEGMASLPSDQIYVKRIAGEPGDQLLIAGGRLYINGRSLFLTNAQGAISYPLPLMFESTAQTNVTVPQGSYFVLGDNSTNSLDSRFFGSLPRGNILGRMAFCYWPPARIGAVK